MTDTKLYVVPSGTLPMNMSHQGNRGTKEAARSALADVGFDCVIDEDTAQRHVKFWVLGLRNDEQVRLLNEALRRVLPVGVSFAVLDIQGVLDIHRTSEERIRQKLAKAQFRVGILEAVVWVMILVVFTLIFIHYMRSV